MPTHDQYMDYWGRSQANQRSDLNALFGLAPAVEEAIRYGVPIEKAPASKAREVLSAVARMSREERAEMASLLRLNPVRSPFLWLPDDDGEMVPPLYRKD
jgi:hypothetical protein